MDWLGHALDPLGAVLLAFLVVYSALQLAFAAIGFASVRRGIRSSAFDDLDAVLSSPFTPPLSIVVPAFNEETTIVESLRSLTRLRFPQMEIIVVNDGSSDGTVARVTAAFDLRRMEITYDERLSTRPVRAFYEKRTGLPPGVTRWVLVDKENGGKADALNAGINAATCPMFVCMDADSILDENALLQAFRVMVRDKRVVAVGGQVGVVNGCEVKDGRVIAVGLPQSRLARFQLIEYLRSFTVGRTALDRLNAVMIISGVFAIFRKDVVVRIGGYLTRSATRKLLHEYVGTGRDTVCEDMEIIVRLRRFIEDKRLDLRIAYTPQPLSWTEVPETIGSLAKQRGRWMRGLLETMLYHRALFLDRKAGRLGWFAYPFFLFFELLAGPIEFLGYVVLPLFWSLGLVDGWYALTFLTMSIACGAFLSVAAVVTGVWLERVDPTRLVYGSLLRYSGTRVIGALLRDAVLEGFGYRQLTLWWRMRGLWDWVRGARGWDKFARKGFGAGAQSDTPGLQAPAPVLVRRQP